MRVQRVGGRLLVMLAAWGALAGCLTGCTTEVAGAPVGVFSAYTPPDGSGYGQMIDQPLPLPPTSISSFECEWMNEALPLLAPLNIRYANGTGSGCQMGAGDTSHEIIQVRLNGPYTPLNQATAMLEPVEIAGLPGRIYLLEPVEDPTFCTVMLDIRAYAAFTVDAFDHRDFAPSAPDNRANCELATKAAEILVKRYVPLAGGTPYEGTEQRPPDKKLRGLEPCEFVTNPISSPVIEDNPKTGDEDFGTTCTYADDNGTLRELITDGTGGLDDLPRQLDDGQASAITFSDYPARLEQTDQACALAIETGDGQVLGVDYTNNGPTDEACQVVSVTLADAIADQIE